MINPFVALQRLFAGQPITVVTIITHNADQTSTVQSAGGSQYRVKGQSVAVGKKAFVRGEQIISEAPSLGFIVDVI